MVRCTAKVRVSRIARVVFPTPVGPQMAILEVSAFDRSVGIIPLSLSLRHGLGRLEPVHQSQKMTRKNNHFSGILPVRWDMSVALRVFVHADGPANNAIIASCSAIGNRFALAPASTWPS